MTDAIVVIVWRLSASGSRSIPNPAIERTQCENPNEKKNINSILNNNNHSMINVYCVFIEFSCNN